MAQFNSTGQALLKEAVLKTQIPLSNGTLRFVLSLINTKLIQLIVKVNYTKYYKSIHIFIQIVSLQ